MKALLPIAGAAVLAAGLGVQPAAQAQPDRDAPRTCFYSHQITNYRADGPRTLYAGAGSQRVFRINLANDCHNLGHNGATIVVEPVGNGAICNAAGLTLTAVSSGYRQRCIVESIERLDPEEIAALPARVRP